MGTWYDDKDNIYSAMADIGRDQYRERFRCMVRQHSLHSCLTHHKHHRCFVASVAAALFSMAKFYS